MYRQIFIIALSGLALSSCEPTERTALAKKGDKTQEPAQTEQVQAPAATPEAQVVVQQTVQNPQPDATEQATAQTEPQPELPPAAEPTMTDPSASLLTVSLTVQEYNLLRPWEKKAASSVKLAGVYLGEGKVLTLGANLNKANYVEISLPDASRTVTARVQSYDSDLNLGLLVVDSEAESAIFADRAALSVGEPLNCTDAARLYCTLDGKKAVEMGLQGEIGTTDHGLPRVQMRSDQVVPSNYTHGAPVVKDGKLVGLTCGFNAATRQLKVINADLINRFLSAAADTPKGMPVMGVNFVELTDPVFRRYLKFSDERTGVYISKVQPGGAAAAAGLQVGDVLTSVEGIKVDNRGRCVLPLYGMIDVTTAVRYLKPLGETLNITFSRDGQEHEAVLPLNRDAEEKALIAKEPEGKAPRYLVWGGLVFQPLTSDYVSAVQAEFKSLPIEYMRLESQEEELKKCGYNELTALSIVLPTKATLGYDTCSFSIVEKVNGVAPHNFAEFVKLLQQPTASGMVELSINKPPYRIYMDAAAAGLANDDLRRAGIIKLQHLAEDE